MNAFHSCLKLLPKGQYSKLEPWVLLPTHYPLYVVLVIPCLGAMGCINKMFAGGLSDRYIVGCA